MFERTLHVGWGDLDFNGHMRNTAYLDKAGDVRMMYFAEQGFSMREFERLRFGPVVFRDEVEYFREMKMLEPIRVTLSLAGLSADRRKFRLRNQFFRPDGELAVRLVSSGGWLDLTARKLAVPPEGLGDALGQLVRDEDFLEL
jgi:acyl-CoA thioester hydrolase